MPPKAPSRRTITVSIILFFLLPLTAVSQTESANITAPPIISPESAAATSTTAASQPADLNPVIDSGALMSPAADSDEPVVEEDAADFATLPATRTTSMDILAAGIQAFLEETEEQHTADPVFRAKLRAKLKKAYLSCPPDFTGLLDDLHALDEEVATATANLPKLREEQARVAQLYSAADSRRDKSDAKQLLDQLTNLNSQVMEAESAAASIHPLRLAYFESLYGEFYGKTCPKNSVLLDGDFCIDIYETPDVKGAMPTVGISYQAAAAACAKQGKRLCARDEWMRACLGPACRPNHLIMKPFTTTDCNPSLNVMSDRPVKPAGAANNCVTPEGVADLFGNAWEWTKGKYKNYYHILRGGVGYRELAPACNATAWAMPDVSLPYAGARCCADPKIKWLPNSDAILPPPPQPKQQPAEPPAAPAEPTEPLPMPNIQPSPGFQ